MKLEKVLSRSPNPYLVRQCNRTPLVLSTRIIENHDNPPTATHKSSSRARVEKENIIAREIRNAKKTTIKPHKHAKQREVDIIGEVLRGRKEGFNIDAIIKKLESCRPEPEVRDSFGRLPPLFIKTYDLRLL